MVLLQEAILQSLKRIIESVTNVRAFPSLSLMLEYADPLLAATGMKNAEDPHRSEADHHVTAGHGDPLLREVEHTHKLALHQTFEGQGDDLMDAALAKMTEGERDAVMGMGTKAPPVDHRRLGVGEKHVGPKWDTGGTKWVDAGKGDEGSNLLDPGEKAVIAQ